MISEIERGLRMYRETGVIPSDSRLAREITRMIVEDEARLVRSDLDDEALDKIEKAGARVRKLEPAEIA